MRIRTIGAVSVVVTLVTLAPAAQSNDARALLEAARKVEVVDGNLRAAIAQYQKIATTYEKSDRTAAAEAVLRLAECYHRLGDSEATGAYERIVREFADQKEIAAAARTRLARTAPPTAVRGDRAVWTGKDVDLFGTVSPDGRYLSYVDWEVTSNLMLRDLRTNTSRALTPNTARARAGGAGYSVISRDGKQIAYEWWNSDPAAPRNELRVAALAGNTAKTSKSIWSSSASDTVRPLDWSPDGRQLLVLVGREDRTSQLALLQLDGTLRILKSVGWRGISKGGFSPDGHFVAYDLARGDGTDFRSIVIMSSDASRESAVTEDTSRNTFMGWSANGRMLLFASDRSGELAVWALPVNGGSADGHPVVVRNRLASSASLGVTAGDTLYIWKSAGAAFVAIVPLDLQSGIAQPKPIFQKFIESRGRPVWSADGKRVLFVSCGPGGGGPCTIDLWSAEHGAVSRVPHSLVYVQFPQVSPDARLIGTNGTDGRGRRGMYMIDVATGATELLAPVSDAIPVFVGWSRDSRSFYFTILRSGRRVLFERDVVSETARELLTLPSCANPKMSPDGRSIACRLREDTANPGALWIGSLNGTPPVVRQIGVESALGWTWAPASDGIVVSKGPSSLSPRELWLAPFSGTPRRIAIDTTSWVEGGHFRVSPDGRALSFVASAGAPGAEVWALENLLPTGSAQK